MKFSVADRVELQNHICRAERFIESISTLTIFSTGIIKLLVRKIQDLELNFGSLLSLTPEAKQMTVR